MPLLPTPTAVPPLLAAALLLGPVLAQGPSGPRHDAPLPGGFDLSRLTDLGDTLILDEPGDGRLWARGATYKASFDSGGFTYTPFLGSDAPRSYPLRLDLTRATLDGVPLGLEPRQRTASERRVELDRGALREVYHLAETQVEQTFHLERLPARGELILELDVETDLTPEAAGPGLRFACEHGAVSYGAATAIDARGRRATLEQRLEDGVLRIVVPAEFLQHATLPLVVDPIVSTLSIAGSTRRQVDVDIAFCDPTTNYQIVYSELASATDQDVFSVFYSESVDALLLPVAIDITSTSWATPSNASAYHAEAFLCAAVTGNSIGSRRVRGRVVDGTTAARTPAFDISGVGAETVDVGGKGNDIISAFDFMVVWQEVDGLSLDMDIVAQAVDAGGTLTAGRIVVDGDPSRLDRKPKISKSTGRPTASNANSQYMVVWEREVSPTDHNIRCQVMDYTGNLSGYPQFAGYTFSDALEPDVSTPNTLVASFIYERHWLVTFERRTGSDYDIFAVVAEDDSAFGAKNLTAMQDVDVQLDQRNPRVAFSEFEYYITYETERANGDRTVELLVANTLDGGPELRTGVSLRRETLGTYAAGESRSAIATPYDGGDGITFNGQPRALFAAPVRATPADDSDIAGGLLDGPFASTTASQYCEAASHSGGKSAWLRARRQVAIGETELRCFDLPANQFGIFLIAADAAFVPNPGGSDGNLCLGGAIGRYSTSAQIFGTGPDGVASLDTDDDVVPIPTGFVSITLNETWRYQAWFRDVGGTSNFSNAVQQTY